MITERQAFLWLGHMADLSPKTRAILINTYGSALEIFNLKETELSFLLDEKIIKGSTYEEILLTANDDWVLRYEERVLKSCNAYITPADPVYPKRLKEIYDMPVTLFYKGNVNLLNEMYLLGVVGSRNPSFYGKEMTKLLSGGIAKNGIVVVSGLAYGIDSDAHRAAIENKGKTIGVLGCGINICYPQRNFGLYQEMSESQLIITEFPPDTKPLGFNFPLRNRIISGLSRGILVIEAREKSGTLITADAALDQGRDIFAVPGRATDELSRGTNKLLRSGAILVTNVDEILEDIMGEDYKIKTKKTTNYGIKTDDNNDKNLKKSDISDEKNAVDQYEKQKKINKETNVEKQEKIDKEINIEKQKKINKETNIENQEKINKETNIEKQKKNNNESKLAVNKSNHSKDYPTSSRPELSDLEKRVISFIDMDPVFMDEILIRSGLSVADGIIVLMKLEKKGYISQPLQGYYVKKLSLNI